MILSSPRRFDRRLDLQARRINSIKLENPVSTAYAEGELEETPEQQDSITRW